MQNAGFAALGLDWAYVPLPTPPERSRMPSAGSSPSASPARTSRRRTRRPCSRAATSSTTSPTRAGSVNTLVIRDGRVLGSSTDGLAVVGQIETEGRRALVLGRGGAAKAVVAALEDAGAEVVTRGRRDRDWPPTADGFDILVNATPVKDELIVAPRAGMQVVDLAYHPDGRPTALVAAAREADCHPCVDGLDVLLAQGAASFERWTGMAAPLVAMREPCARSAGRWSASAAEPGRRIAAWRSGSPPQGSRTAPRSSRS